ncbi:unnamed protein product [Litomosoides sigmodontis]|uniref:Uncharacterized protein n=1 Tax=Litomosoides sigmodontis TaxID=42156 RepID=A0A3P6THC6_LITSI|nr:unnamed protein product [Litomosoides sigmodontis]
MLHMRMERCNSPPHSFRNLQGGPGEAEMGVKSLELPFIPQCRVCYNTTRRPRNTAELRFGSLPRRTSDVN